MAAMMRRPAVALCLAFACGLLGRSHCKTIIGVRGVAPAAWPTFFQGELFGCDGGKTLPKARVNDNFCDCADGADEPGTAACATTAVPGGVSSLTFFCHNAGFESATVFSSRVNDGVCDCCDGSDEWGTEARCANTCAGAGGGVKHVDREGLRRGAQARKAYLAEFAAKFPRSREAAPPESSVALMARFGPDAAYFGLRDSCFDIKSGVFNYKFCPQVGGRATQSEQSKDGLSEVSLGTMDPWGAAQPGAAAHELRFRGGDKCGDGANAVVRSLTVTAKCGPSNKIMSEDEPSMCRYIMDFETPAACDAAALAAANLDAEGNPVEHQTEEEVVVYHDEL